MDGPNIFTELYFKIFHGPLNDENCCTVLRNLRCWNRAILGINRCLFAYRVSHERPKSHLRELAQSCDWRWVGCDATRHGHDRKDPVDDYIDHMLVESTGKVDPTRRGILSLVSHDGGYARFLEPLLASGGHVALVGLRRSMSHKLTRLATAYPEQVVLFDLQDMGVLPDRSGENHHARPLPDMPYRPTA